PAERLNVFAQGGHFQRLSGCDDGDRAVLDPGGHRLEARRLHPADHFTWGRGGGDVDVAMRLSGEGVGHCAAADARLLAVAVERGENIAQRRLSKPGGVDASRHFVLPGTKWPSSICAGTEAEPAGRPPHCANTMKLPITSTSATSSNQATRGRLQESGCSTPARV